MRYQWLQLAVLGLVHIYLDMFAGVLPAILPVVRREFNLSLRTGVSLITVLYLTCNGVQMLVGHLRPGSRRPLFLLFGMWLVPVFCLLSLVPNEGHPLAWLVAIMIVCGAGIAIAHPEAMRAVHALHRIPAPLSSPLFLTGGAIGIAGGAWLGAILVSRWHLPGLLWLIPFALVGTVALLAAKIELAVDEPAPVDKTATDTRLPFWLIFAMTVPVATGTVVLCGLLPERLHEVGFRLSFGGLSTMLFMGGSAIGGVAWGAIAHRKGEMWCCMTSLAAGCILILVYLLRIESKLAAWFLLCAGLCIGGGYPLLLSLSRYTRGPVLGMRMALMAGGTGGIASLVLLGLGPVAEGIGIQKVLHLSWVLYLVAALAALAARSRTAVVVSAAQRHEP